MSHSRNGSIQVGYAGEESVDLTISSDAVVIEGIDAGPFDDMDGYSFTSAVEELDIVSGSDLYAGMVAWEYPEALFEPVVTMEIPADVGFSRASSILVATAWAHHLPEADRPLQRAPAVYLRAEDTYLFPEPRISLGFFREQVDEVESILSDVLSEVDGPPAPVGKGILANIRALVFFKKQTGNRAISNPPAPVRKPSIWKRKSSNRVEVPTGSIVTYRDENGNEIISTQDFPRRQSLFNILPPILGIRRKDVSQTA